MPETICTIAGTTYKLVYSKHASKLGIYFIGTAFNPAMLQFSFVDDLENSITTKSTFQPVTEPDYVKDAVITAVLEKEQNEATGGFRNEGEAP